MMSNFDNTSTVTHKRRAKTPSFSSILLDSIYRSIDDTDSSSSAATTTTTTTITTNNSNDHNNNYNYDHYIKASKHRRTKMRSDSNLETIELRHAIMMERQPPQLQKPYYYHSHYIHNNNVDQHNIKIIRQKSVPSRSRATNIDNNNNNNCSSSDFASAISSSCFMPSKIRTNPSPRPTDNCLHVPKVPSSREREISSSTRIFTKTKSRALKIYSELKKSKQQQQQQQPISPGARIAAFLNSIFRNTGGTNAPVRRSPASTPATVSTSTCSSASSFSRSCLSNKTTTDKSKRSVRFYPVSVIVDEDSRPCGQKSLYKNKDKFLYNDPDSAADETKEADSDHQQQRQRRWKTEKEIDALMMMVRKNCSESHDHQREVLCFESDSDMNEEMNVDDEEEDGESCASSDLFELENLSSIGVSRFCPELPVYGTTSLNNLTV